MEWHWICEHNRSKSRYKQTSWAGIFEHNEISHAINGRQSTAEKDIFVPEYPGMTFVRIRGICRGQDKCMNE